MRRLFFSTTAVILLAAPALAQPHGDESHPNHVGKASMGPQVQEHAQAQLRAQAPQQQQGGRDHGDHGRGPAPQALVQAPPNRGDRGFDRGHTPPQMAIQTPQNRGDQNRDHGDNGRHRGQDNNFQNNRGQDNRQDNRNQNNRAAFNENANRDFNRDGRTDFRPDNHGRPNMGGPRHDFSGFRDYHRDFRVSRRFYAPAYRRPAGWYDHRWSFGEFLPAAFWARDYWLVDFADYDLPPPPYGAAWVRVGQDALLIDEDSGEIITVAYGVFY